MFHISSSCDHQQDPWSHNFTRVMSRVFRLHQNFATRHVVDLIDHCITTHFITSSRITSMSSRKRHATLCIIKKLYTHIDRWSFRFLLSRLNRNFVLEPCAPLATWIAKIINLLMSSEMSWVVHIKITRAVIWISLDTEYPRCAASPCVALQHVQTYTR